MGNGKGCLEGVGNVLNEKYAHFAGKRVLVTGHTGFKGSWLVLWLRRLGADVAGYALDPVNEKGNFLRARVGEGLADHRGDIRDFAKLSSVFSRHDPEIVFHLAARAIVREGYREPRETFEVNVCGTVNVLEACRRALSVRAVVNVTSDKCYLNKGKAAPYRESDRLGGFDPYSSSKACAELASAAYGHSFFGSAPGGGTLLGLATARAGNVIGGGDWSLDRIVPDCIRALQAGEPIRIRNPRHIRPWQFVLEPLAGYLALAANLLDKPGNFTGAWNFGPERGSTVPVSVLVKKIIKAYGRGSWLDEIPEGQPMEAQALALDAAKAKDKLGWLPALNLDRAVAMTVDWYKRSEAGGDMRDFSLAQIEAYMAASGGSKWKSPRTS